MFTVESPVHRAVWVIPLADPTGVLGSIWPKDIVTANFLEAPQGHKSFMKKKGQYKQQNHQPRDKLFLPLQPNMFPTQNS